MSSKPKVTGVKVICYQLANDQQTSKENLHYPEIKQINIYKDMGLPLVFMQKFR